MKLLLMSISFLQVALVISDDKKKEQKLDLSKTVHPRYAFNYAVNDPISKDNKAQWEARNGDIVKGAYSLREPDGSIRVVEYSATDLDGFSALVKKIGANYHPTPILSKPLEPIIPIVPLTPIRVAAIPTEVPSKSDLNEHHSVTKPIDVSLNYGFGAAPLSIGLPKVTSLGHWSLPWDPVTGSYGGWVPLDKPVPRGAYATIFSKKYINGKLYRWTTGPLYLGDKNLVIKKEQLN